ncbi:MULTISPECIES: hypothetical protein [unclassified Streptomyces]|uniref:hypothetical protein n=1 Tax=unclassified Streptomyces TaxID=2593676 RepID=UPI002270A103|nr:MULTISPECIES: hypothetical protein [unclassified Streptomyces]MCY0922583.1 hypothetical protein [Streptomyces sp. H27-G5]MCY0961620.1 hypothetical protein [Streptomyces sp. H27-H5]
MEDNKVSPDKEPQGRLGGYRNAIVAGAAVMAVGVGIAAWQPWLDRDPFTAYQVGLQEAQYTVPGSSPGTCVRMAASEEERVIYDEDGERLAAGRDPREGEVLGPEFGEFAGDCLFTSPIDNVPGGKGTYVVQWGGGTRSKYSEEDMRESAKLQKERFKTKRKSDFKPSLED